MTVQANWGARPCQVSDQGAPRARIYLVRQWRRSGCQVVLREVWARGRYF